MPAGAIPFPFGECRICNDKATGVHYGVATCEGCKGFFKRSTTKSEKYKCFFGSQCVITPQNRNRCKFCRYKRCLEKGMAIDAVKMGRIPKIDKERALEAARNGVVVGGHGGMDEGHLSSSDSGISDTTCQQIAERFFPSMPSGDNGLNGLASPRDCWSADPPARNSGTPCSINSGCSDTFTLQSSSGKRWHYSTEMIKELLNQVMGSQHAKTMPTNVLKKFIRNLNQQQDSPEKAAVLQESGIDSQNNLEFQNVYKKINRTNQRDFRHEKTDFDVNSTHIKQEHSLPCDQSIPDVSEILSSVNQSFSHQYQYTNGVEFSQPHLATKRKSEESFQNLQPPNKVSTLETLLRNQFLPPSKMEDIDRFLSDAVRHSGTQERENYEDLLDNTNLLSAELMQSDPSTIPRTEAFLVPSDNNSEQCDSGQIRHMNGINRSCEPSLYDHQLTDSFDLSTHNSLSSQVESVFYSSQQIATTTTCPSNSLPLAVPSAPHSSQNTSFSSYNSVNSFCPVSRGTDHPSLSPELLQSPVFPGDNMPYDMQSVVAVPYDFNMQNKDKMLPSTSTSSYGMNGYSGQGNYITSSQESSMDVNVKKGYAENGGQYTVSGMEPLLNPAFRPLVTSACPQASQSPASSVYARTDSRPPSSSPPTKSTPPLNASPGLAAYNQRAGVYDQPPLLDHFEANIAGSSLQVPVSLPELTILPQDGPKSPESDNGDIALMERTIQRVAEADLKHNQFLRDNRKWMINFMNTTDGKHPPANKSQEGIGETWSKLIGSVQPVNKRIIGFCNDVPGFTRLDEEDRKVMIGKAYYDIWMVYSAQYLRDGESYLQFPEGDPYTREWMTHFLGKSFVDLMFEFSACLNSCKLTDVELGILAAIQLTYPDREGIRKLDEIKSLHSHYLDVLDYAMSKSHPSNHSRLLIDIFKLLPQLTRINQLQQDIVANFDVDGPPGLKKKESDSPKDPEQGKTINDLQNTLRKEMDMKKNCNKGSKNSTTTGKV